jgi:hypothetical protein
MSDELRKDEETEVEGHVRRLENDEPAAEGEDDDDDIEAHVRHANVRMDSPRHI